MDRLVVGDVGYGKTEVAMRAAALGRAGGQAGRRSPLPRPCWSRQHLESFRRRFEGTGIVVAGLSRLSTAAEKKAVKAGLADGSIQIVDRHRRGRWQGRRLSRPALVVIDEEQRFGAADKAKLRGLGDVPLLTLTATPIPRTLQIGAGRAPAGLGHRDPAGEAPADPHQRSESSTTAIVRTALMREKGRGGQSFVVVPRIEDMAPIAERLARLVPDL